MKRKVLVAALLAICVLAFGASTWEGSAIISDGVTFPTDGLFGACNSFPVNSSVEVQNLENGKKVTVVITATVDNPAVFMALSPMAASALGMKAGASARVRVLAPSAASATPAPSSPATALPSKAGESTDPDYNPRALAAVAANPYDASAISKGQDFMSVLGAGYASQADTAALASPSTSASPSSAAPAAVASSDTAGASTATPTTAAPAAEPVRLLESAASESPRPLASSSTSSVPPPSNPPVPETSASSVQAPSAASPAAELATPAATARTTTAEAPVDAGKPEASTAAMTAPSSKGEASLANPRPLEPESISDTAQAAGTSTPPAVGLAAPEAAEGAAVAEASPEAETGPEPYALEMPGMIKAEKPVLALADPPTETGKPAATAEAAAVETGPSLSDVASKSPTQVASAVGLPDPALGPDILPEALLDRLANPENAAPSVALADCDVELSGYETPEALAAGAPSRTTAAAGPTELAEAAPPAAPEKGLALAVPPLEPVAGKPAASAAVALASPSAPAPAAAKAAEPPAAAATTTTLTPTAPQPPKATVAPAAAAAAPAQPSAAAAAPPPAAPAPVSVAVIPKGTPAREPTDVRMLEGMVKGSYYVQIGLFGSEEALRQAISAVGKQFPILYERVDAGKGKILYRLFVGPIKRDESGIVLTKVKALGYKDAVLKQG